MRLFVALDLPWMLRDRLSALAGAGLPGARWVPPENYHLTLRFIGETPRHRAEDIDTALAGLRARGFSLTLAGCRHVHQRRAQHGAMGGRGAQPATGASAEQDRDRVATLRPGTGTPAVSAACHAGAAGQCAGGKTGVLRPGAQSVSGRTGAGRALYPVQLAVGQGSFGLYGRGRIRLVSGRANSLTEGMIASVMMRPCQGLGLR